MSAATLSDADLHALVDGHLDADRRAQVLRRAAASPRDRALVEAWQDQRDWLRGAFAGVESEQIPPSLDLGRVRHLHAVDFEPPIAAPAPTASARRWRGSAATLAAMALGLAGSWYVATRTAQPVSPPAALPAEASAPRTAAPLPTSTIPDLTRGGYAFAGAERPAATRGDLVFHYSGPAGETVEVGVRDASLPARADTPDAVSWTDGRAAYTLTGGATFEARRALAAILRRAEADTVARP